MLDLTPLDKVLASLQKAIDRSQKEPDDEEVRDAVIQRFQYCYELSWKMLKRQLEREEANPSAIDRMPFKEMIRTAAERDLIKDPEKWFEFRRQRNLTSHVYDEKKAVMVYNSALEFYTQANILLADLQNRNLTA